jgi:hypothetical protein
VSHCCRWWIAWIWYDRNFSCYFHSYVYLSQTFAQTRNVVTRQRNYVALGLGGLRISTCFTKSRKLFRCEVMFVYYEHVLLVNIRCLYLHDFCASGVSSGLATRVTLIVMGEVWRVLHGGGPVCGSVVGLCDCCFLFWMAHAVFDTEKDCYSLTYMLVYKMVVLLLKNSKYIHVYPGPVTFIFFTIVVCPLKSYVHQFI